MDDPLVQQALLGSDNGLRLPAALHRGRADDHVHVAVLDDAELQCTALGHLNAAAVGTGHVTNSHAVIRPLVEVASKGKEGVLVLDVWVGTVLHELPPGGLVHGVVWGQGDGELGALPEVARVGKVSLPIVGVLAHWPDLWGRLRVDLLHPQLVEIRLQVVVLAPENTVAVRAAETKGRHLAVALGVVVASALGLEDRVKRRVLQVRVQRAHVQRGATLRVFALQDALDHGTHGRAALQVADVALVRTDHQRLRARHPDLHLSHGPDLDRVTQGCACAVALPDRRLRGCHLRLLDRARDHLLLRWPVGRCQAGAAAILAHLRRPQHCIAAPPVVAVLDHEATDALSAEVAVG
mmetsp:Transcript_56224/g.174303  ORF Transcript_56224/g.174303 Transcript_56224/m.174303 type:complete len:352 (+) Transcript_56224:156-1211(+)